MRLYQSMNPKLTWLFYIFGMLMILSALFGEQTYAMAVVSVGVLFYAVAWIVVLFNIVRNPQINKASWILLWLLLGGIAIPAYLIMHSRSA